jgi:hypothetical protein
MVKLSPGRFIAVLFVVLASLAGIGYLVVLKTVTAPWLEARLQERVAEKTDSLYTLHIDSVYLDIPGGVFKMLGVSLKPQREVPKGKAALEVGFEALEINRMHWLKYLWKRELYLTSIRLIAPEVVLRDAVAKTEGKSENDSHEATADTARSVRDLLALIPPAVQKIASSFRVDTLSIERASVQVVGSGLIKLSGFNGAVRDFYVSGNPESPVMATNFQVSATQFELMPPKRLYRMQVKDISASVADSALRVASFSWVPTRDDPSFFKRLGHRDMRIISRLESIDISGWDFLRLFFDRELSIKRMSVKKAELDLFTDNRYPKKTPVASPSYRLFPHEQFQKVKLAAGVDTLVLRAFTMTIREMPEYAPKDGKAALLRFAGTRLAVTGLRKKAGTNVPADTARITMYTKLMGKADMRAHILYPLSPGPWSGTMNITIEKLQASDLNPFTGPLARLEFKEKARIHTLQAKAIIKNNQATGEIDAEYEDLGIRVLRKNSDEARKLVSAIGNMVLLNDNVSRPGKERRKGRIEHMRDTTKGYPVQLWLQLQPGLMEILLPPMALNMVKKQQEKAAAPASAAAGQKKPSAKTPGKPAVKKGNPSKENKKSRS